MKTLNHLFIIVLLSVTAAYNTACGQSSITDDGAKFQVTAMGRAGDLIFAATRYNGVYMSRDGGTSWAPVNTGLPPAIYVIEMTSSGNTLFAIALGYRLYQTTDNGANWKQAVVCPTDSAVTQITVFKGRLFAGTRKGLYRSADNGASWTPVPGVEAGNIESVVSGDDHILAWQHVAYNKNIFYSSTDGVDWNIVKGEDVNPEATEAHGRNIIARICWRSRSEGGYYTCQATKLWLLSRNGKKWEEMDKMPRYFEFDGDTIYALSGQIKRDKKKTYVFEKAIERSDNRGKSWYEMDAKTDPFLSTDKYMQEKLDELALWEKLEVAENIAMHDAAEKYRIQKAKDDMAAREKEIKWDRERGSQSRYQSQSSGRGNSSSGPDYRALSNERFKEMHNHRDTWIDSKGSLHLH